MENGTIGIFTEKWNQSCLKRLKEDSCCIYHMFQWKIKHDNYFFPLKQMNSLILFYDKMYFVLGGGQITLFSNFSLAFHFSLPVVWVFVSVRCSLESSRKCSWIFVRVNRCSWTKFSNNLSHNCDGQTMQWSQLSLSIF